MSAKFEEWVQQHGWDVKSLDSDEFQKLSWCYYQGLTITKEELQAYVNELRKARAAHAKLREDLWWALRSRVLTPEEMKQVREFGSSINTPTGSCYDQHEKEMELLTALFNQARLQLIAAGKGDMFE